MPLWAPYRETSKELAQKLGPTLSVVTRDAAKRTVDRYDLGVDWNLVNEEAVKWAGERGAELVGMKEVGGHLMENPASWWEIEETTRGEINGLLGRAIEEGWSYQQLGREVQASGIFEGWRADMIARTEIALAQAKGTAIALREAGVERVVIQDGDSDEACQEADGQVWDIEEYEDNPIEHPNCVRSARPLTAAERAEDEGEGEADREEEAA
jgi:hypothetical protein